MFNVQKLIQIVNHILGKYAKNQINYTKLIKELYLADKECLFKYGYPISEAKYACLPKGPVLEELLRLIKQEHRDPTAQALWNNHFKRDKYNLVKVSNDSPSTDLLTEHELEVLDEVDRLVHKKHYGILIDMVHNPSICPETIETGSSVELSLHTILTKNGVSSEDAHAWENEKAFQDRLALILG